MTVPNPYDALLTPTTGPFLPLESRYDVRNGKTLVPVTEKPQDIHIMVAGGRTYFAAVLPGWGSFGGYAATALVRTPGN